MTARSEMKNRDGEARIARDREGYLRNHGICRFILHFKKKMSFYFKYFLIILCLYLHGTRIIIFLVEGQLIHCVAFSQKIKNKSLCSFA